MDAGLPSLYSRNIVQQRNVMNRYGQYFYLLLRRIYHWNRIIMSWYNHMMSPMYKSKEDWYLLSLLMNLLSRDLRMMLVTILSVSGYLLYLFQNISVLYCEWRGEWWDDDDDDPELAEDENDDTDEALDLKEKVERRGFSLTRGFLCMVSWWLIRLSLLRVS